jgi:hypothetical protein
MSSTMLQSHPPSLASAETEEEAFNLEDWLARRRRETYEHYEELLQRFPDPTAARFRETLETIPGIDPVLAQETTRARWALRKVRSVSISALSWTEERREQYRHRSTFAPPTVPR